MTDTPHPEDDGSADATRTSGQPQPIEPQPKRLVNLSNTLGKRPIPQRTLEPSPPVNAPPAQTPDAGPAQPATTPAAGEAEPEQPGQRRRSSTPRTRSTSRQSGGAADAAAERTRPTRLRDHTVFYVSLEVSEQVRDLARRESLTNADVIFDAIEATHTDLPALLGTPEVPAAGGRLFARTERRPVGKKVQISAVISDANLEAIDGIATKLGAESRSQLVETALTAYFSGRDAISA